MNLSLYQMNLELKEALDAIAEKGGEIELSDEQRINHLTSLLSTKTDACAGWRQTMLDYAAAIDARMTELKDLLDGLNARVERFDDYVLDCLKLAGTESFKGEFYEIKARKPSKKVEVFDESLLPVEFVHIPEPAPKIMASEIAKRLKAGEEVPGARLIDGKKSVTSKTKREP